jgi:hypothetical protein
MMDEPKAPPPPPKAPPASPPKVQGPTDYANILFRLLEFVDSPFKLFVVTLLAVLGYSGFFFHSNYQMILAVYHKQLELPKLNSSRFDDVAAIAMRETKADILVIFKVDPILNKRVVERAYQREGGREAKVEGVDVGLFTSNQANNQDVVALLASEIPCGDYRRPQSEIGLWYMAKGITYTCRVSVPPEINQFIGQITLGWKVKPENLDYIRDILTVAAGAISKEK